MSNTKLGTVKTVFGIDDTTPPTFGRLTGVTETKTAEKAEVKDEQGNIIGAIYHGHKTELTIEAEYLTEDAPTGPNIADPIGGLITVPTADGEITGNIDSVTKTSSSTENCKLSITATFYPNLSA